MYDTEREHLGMEVGEHGRTVGTAWVESTEGVAEVKLAVKQNMNATVSRLYVAKGVTDSELAMLFDAAKKLR